MGRSEHLIAQLKRERKESLVVATKAGRRLVPHTAAGYNEANLRAFIEDSLRNLATDSLDLVQLHCPPTDVYYQPELFGFLDRLVEEGKIRHYGVSVERVEEALKAIEYPHVQTVQIIYNCLRQRPAGLFFQEAARREVGILARVPLASGLLTGKLTAQSQFAPDDHRSFNRHGEAFDVGETFSGVDYQTALAAVEELRGAAAARRSMAQFALRWILMSTPSPVPFPGVNSPRKSLKTAPRPACRRSLPKLWMPSGASTTAASAAPFISAGNDVPQIRRDHLPLRFRVTAGCPIKIRARF